MCGIVRWVVLEYRKRGFVRRIANNGLLFISLTRAKIKIR